MASALMGLAAAADDKPSVVCDDDANIVLTIPYDRNNTDVLDFSAGDCTKDDITYSQNKTSFDFTFEVNLVRCGLRKEGRVEERKRRDISERNIFFDPTAHVELGTSDDGINFVMWEGDFNMTCGVKDTYEVSIDYGIVNADHEQELAGGEKEYTFTMTSYDSDFAEEADISNRAGDTVHLVIAGDAPLATYKFAPTHCWFEESNTTAVVTKYDLFSSDKCENKFLDFTIAYDQASNSYRITHTVFTFDPERANNYTMKCSIKLCDWDIEDSVKVCDALEKECETAHGKPVDGKWGDYGDWETCSKTCGKGVQRRERSCDDPKPENGGKVCEGEDKEEQECNPQSCVIEWCITVETGSIDDSEAVGTKQDLTIRFKNGITYPDLEVALFGGNKKEKLEVCVEAKKKFSELQTEIDFIELARDNSVGDKDDGWWIKKIEIEGTRLYEKNSMEYSFWVDVDEDVDCKQHCMLEGY